MKRFLLILLLTLFCFSNANSQVRAGVEITNVAVATYEDPSGFNYSTLSNPIKVEVAAVYGILILPDYQEINAISGEDVEIPYTLKNTGNSQDAYLLFPLNLTGDDGDLENLKVFIDENDNGVVDLGEPQYDNDNPPKLEPGQTVSLILSAKVPVSVTTGNYKVSLEGVSKGDKTKTDKGNVAVVKVKSEGFVLVKKSVNKNKVRPGDELSFNINFENPAMFPVKGINVSADFDGDGNPEVRKGVLVEDDFPLTFSFKEVEQFVPDGIVLYKGELDSFWKSDRGKVRGEIRKVALFLPDKGSGAIEPDQRGYFRFKLRVKPGSPSGIVENVAKVFYGSSSGEQSATSNPVSVTVEKIISVVADDTDDGISYSGSGTSDDPDDLMVIDEAVSGQWVWFKNEVWNLGNSPEVINLVFDKKASKNLIRGVNVVFYSLSGVPLTDTNGDGLVDVGSVEPGKRVEFITKVFLPKGDIKDLIVAIKAVAASDPSVSDLTFDEVVKAEPTAVKVLSRVQTFVQGSYQIKDVPISHKKLIAYEYDSSGKLVRKKVFWTDKYGYILYDEDGKVDPIYNWMREGYTYRLALGEEVNGFLYYLMPPFRKSYFDAVNSPGEKKCWDSEGKEVSCSSNRARMSVEVTNDGTKVLLGALDPAGYVYDGVTGKKINGACVKFYRCTDGTCSSYSLVDPSRLDLYPDGVTPQENPQVSGPTDVNSNPVGKTDGSFEFIFSAFDPAVDTGWYFVTVTFDCNYPAADPTLADKYDPVTLNRSKVWSPTSGQPYLGEKFYIDSNFPGTILMRIPLLPSSFKNLEVRKEVSPSSASVGDFVKWTIKVRNPNSSFTVYGVKLTDYLPRGVKYRPGTTKVNGSDSSDPSVSPDGQRLEWSLGDIPPNTTVEVSFYTVVTPGVKEGRLKNVAEAFGWFDPAKSIRIGSNRAFAYLKVGKGLFTDRAYIIGRVFIDDNGNGIFDKGEVGVKGVKIYMEDGRFVVTDSEGKYHFDDVKPGTHVLKVDRTTIPGSGSLELISNRNAEDPGTYFADVFPGDIFKVNFALVPKKVVVKKELSVNRVEGLIKIKRVIKPTLVDPSSGKVGVKNFVFIENRSNLPLYELVYSENSPYKPQEGTVYLNSSPFEDPLVNSSSFSWRLPLLQPSQQVVISWLSSVPAAGGKAQGNLSFSLKPYEGDSLKVPVSVPVIFEVVKPKVYRLTICFPFASYELTDSAKECLRKVAQFLRKRDYQQVFIKVVGHTDSISIRKDRKDYLTNEELSLKRAKAVKEFLEKLLIDTRKVEVER